MVEYAKRSKKIFVPTKEGFDHYRFSKFFEENSEICPAFETLVDRLYRREADPFFQQLHEAGCQDGGKLPGANDVPHTLFKWRPFPIRIPGNEGLKKVFAVHQVKPVVLVRRSLVDQALKIFLSQTNYGTRHPQHHTIRMSDDQYKEYIEAQNDISIVVSDEDMELVRANAKNFLVRTRKSINAAAHYFAHGLPYTVLIAEDIFNPNINYSIYSAFMTHILNDEIVVAGEERVALRKGGLDASHCANAEAVFGDPALMELEARYAELVYEGKQAKLWRP